MSKPTVTVTTLTATAADGSTFTVKRGPLGNHNRDGWKVEGPLVGNGWPSVIGITPEEATILLSDCVEAFNRWHAATIAANEQLDEQREAIKGYFRKAKSDG